MSDYKFHVCNWCNEYSTSSNPELAKVHYIYSQNASNIEVIEGYRYLIRLSNKLKICLKCYLAQS